MALPKQIIPTLQAKLSEPVFTQRKGSPKATAVLVGCGIGNDPKALKFALEQGKSTVIDADAINLLAEDPELLQNFLDKYPKAQVILTPHPAEFARFMKTSVQKVEADRLAAARKFAEQYPTVTLVLKGHHTIVAHGESFFMNLTGNPGLSKGGSGDVLAGMIASFLAQGYSATEAALCGVYLHGAAANELRKELSEHGMLPSDLPIAVARLLKEFETIA
jgi:NAD(P)H-hydrate epimerase